MKKTTKSQLQQPLLISGWFATYTKAKDKFQRGEISDDELKQIIAVMEAECLLEFGTTVMIQRIISLDQ